MSGKNWFIAIVLFGLILFSGRFASAAVNQTLKDDLLPYVDVQYDFVNGTIDEVMIYNRTLTSAEINESIASSPQGAGEIWNCSINATDSTGAAGLPTSKAITSNSAPNISSMSLLPSPAYTDNTLNCSAIYGDPDGGKGNVSMTFYNGSTSSSYSTTTKLNVLDLQMVSQELTANIQATGEIWSCSINATDSQAETGLANTTVTDYIRTNLTGYVLEVANRLANARVVIINQSDNRTAGSTLTNSTGGWNFDVNVNGYYMAVAYFNNTLRGAASPYVRAN